ncbi:MAG: 5,10-methylenetetrahydrofolate reductase [Alphaproteobacteria bacterium]|nr:MAG: 5,10-methylenetetrahydrofolate reductase [Alphaproteobacteria bacterium]
MRISLEFFPPKGVAESFRLALAAERLATLAPEFVSVTYGAGGSTRALTLETAEALRQRWGFEVVPHLTCVGATRGEVLAVAERYVEAGFGTVMALRGDPPGGAGPFRPHPEGFANSVELVRALARMGDLRIGVAAYPERHPEAADADADFEWLRRKFDAGASFAITQFFFDVEAYLRLRDRAAAAGIDAPIIPGLLPVSNWTTVRRFAERCGASLPRWLVEAFERARRDGRERLLAVAVATEIADRLRSEGVEQLHLFTLNRATLSLQLCAALGIGPSGAPAAGPLRLDAVA